MESTSALLVERRKPQQLPQEGGSTVSAGPVQVMQADQGQSPVDTMLQNKIRDTIAPHSEWVACTVQN